MASTTRSLVATGSRDELDPDIIRGLRGTRSRTAFASLLGVAPHTVYRWEAADGSAHARRPRGEVRERLLRMLAGEPAPRTPEPLPALPALPRLAYPSTVSDPEAIALQATVERILDGDWRGRELPLIEVLASRRDASLEARALAGSGLALIELLMHCDPRRALTVLAPFVEVAALSARTAALVEATCALAYALPDGRLFDIGRVHAHAARATALIATTDAPEVACLARLAEVIAATLIGDEELLGRAQIRLDELSAQALPHLLAMHVEQQRAFHCIIAGEGASALERLTRLMDDPRLAACAPLHARVAGYLALRQLDDLGDLDQTLALARRSKDIARQARLGAGIHTAIAAKAEAEALIRAGRLDEAGAALAEVDQALSECEFPSTIAVGNQVRLYLITGRHAELLRLAEKLDACDLGSLRPMCTAHATYVRGVHALFTGDLERAVTLLARAEELAGRWMFLRRDVLLWRAAAVLASGGEEEGRAAHRRLQRLVERAPSAWLAAHARRFEGLLAVANGRWAQGLPMLEAAAATFRMAGDTVDAMLTQYAAGCVAAAVGQPGADAALVQLEGELRAIGLVPMAFVKMAAEHARGHRGDLDAGADAATAVLVALQRLSVTGASPAMVQRELIAVVGDVVPGHPVRLEELRSDGAPLYIGGAELGEGTEWHEFGDGAGRRLRLGVGGRTGGRARAVIGALVLAAGLALEVATLRGLSSSRVGGGPDDGLEVPGLIAASPPMRRLRADLIRLAGSRSTVIITGESGAGKEVIARALHDLSPRSARPYVALNCAATPRELFEGQLFGHRRGAFTGAGGDAPGVIRAAAGGTVFLDEIGELPLEVQPKLLRFLENGEVFPLGATAPLQVDVRVLAATHRDLAALVRAGQFREDLFYRLQVVPVTVPPLRERRDDVPVLARHFVRALTPAGQVPPVLSPDAVAALQAHSWPGNVRELRNVIERAMAFAPLPDVLTRADLRV